MCGFTVIAASEVARANKRATGGEYVDVELLETQLKITVHLLATEG